MKKGIALLVLLAVGIATVTSQQVPPNTFASGDVISASEMNENFTAIFGTAAVAWGKVTGTTGALDYGSSNVTIHRDSAGDYRIEFSDFSFGDDYLAFIQIYGMSGTSMAHVVTDQLGVFTFDLGGPTQTDRSFFFIVFDPRGW